MTRTIDVLMPAAGDGYAPAAAKALQQYRAAFAAHGLAIAERPWNLGPGDGAATLALFAWGYHFDVAGWEKMLAAWPADRPLFNPPALLRWNTRKTYLSDLQARGIPIVPSIFGTADDASVAAAFDTFGCDEIVVKPQVSAGSDRTVRVIRNGPVAPMGDAIIQPFLAAVGDEGELSFLFIDGAFSHAVRKVAAPGDFRIQPQFGGVFTRLDPEPAQLAQAAAVLAALPEATLYARVDLLRLDGSLALMEIEAIEPDLYADLEPALPVRLAAAIARRL